MPDALEDRLLADARRDEVAPPSFDHALATAVDGRRTRAPWLAVAATAVVVCGAAVALAAVGGRHDTTPAAGPSAPSSSTADEGWADRAVFDARISTAKDPRLLSLLFALGPSCPTPKAQVTETASTVTVRGTVPPLSSTCHSGVLAGRTDTKTVDVRLAAPLGNRPVIDAVAGRAIGVTDLSDEPLLSPVPAGYRPGMINILSFPGSTDENTMGLDYEWQDRNGNTLFTHAGGREGIALSAPVGGEVDGVPARILNARFSEDQQHPTATAARCVTWTPPGKQDRLICGTATAFDTAALLELAAHYR